VRCDTGMKLHGSNPVLLLVRIPGAVCGLMVGDVVETMRPLPVEPLANVPDFIRGIALIRGAAVPVIELAALFQAHSTGPITRFLTVRVGERCVALAVESVIGIAELDENRFAEMPPLLKSARTESIEAIGTLDAELLVLLRASRLVPEPAWKNINRSEAAAR
jgi:purine-binding chemotaxis protein CheW